MPYTRKLKIVSEPDCLDFPQNPETGALAQQPPDPIATTPQDPALEPDIQKQVRAI